MSTELLIWLLPLPPLLAFFFIVLFTNRSKTLSHTLAVGIPGDRTHARGHVTKL